MFRKSDYNILCIVGSFECWFSKPTGLAPFSNLNEHLHNAPQNLDTTYIRTIRTTWVLDKQCRLFRKTQLCFLQR